MSKTIICLFLALIIPCICLAELDPNNIAASTGAGCTQGSNETQEQAPDQESNTKFRCILFDQFIVGACGCDEQGNIKDTGCLQKYNKSSN